MIQLCIEGLLLVLQGLIARNAKILEQPAAQRIEGLAQDLTGLADRPKNLFALLPGRSTEFVDEPPLANARFPGNEQQARELALPQRFGKTYELRQLFLASNQLSLIRRLEDLCVTAQQIDLLFRRKPFES